MHIARTLSLGLLSISFGLGASAGTFTVTNTAASGAGSMRQAILDSKANPDSDTINFNIPGAGPHVIQPTTNLPALTTEVLIDGTSQPGYAGVPIIVIDGSLAGASVNGMQLVGGNSVVKALAIHSFSANGLRFNTLGGNTVEGCYIGLQQNGTTVASNGSNGIIIDNIPNNVIGGTTAAARNVITGNGANGLRISGAGSTGNRVEGNYIGLNRLGTGASGNGLTSGSNLFIDEASNNTVGGSEAARNYVAGAPNGVGVNITGVGAVGNEISFNYIGTDITGMNNLPNSFSGMAVTQGAKDTIVRNNLLSGNFPGAGGGIKIEFGANGTQVQGNLIGTDVTGNGALGNFRGILIQGANDNVIGGPNPADRNIIAGNESNGVAIQTDGATGNLVEGNLIGLDIDGDTAMGNGNNGVTLRRSDNIVRNNVISANAFHGVQLLDEFSVDNQVYGNLIGTNEAGTAAIPNGSNGVSINSGASDNQIGLAGSPNVISGNGNPNGNGVRIDAATSTGNLIRGNRIGTRLDGVTALPNVNRGVYLTNGASSNMIGGEAASDGNTIAFNGNDGVGVESGTMNSILGNSIFNNGSTVSDLGIDLWDIGVNLNDPDDPDSGANDKQNFPILSGATAGGCEVTVTGSLDSVALTTYRIEIFSNTTCDNSGHGQGELFLTAADVATNAAGIANFMIDVAAQAGFFLSATATDPDGNTSELSTCFQVPSSLLGGLCLFSDGFESGNTTAWDNTVP